ncbi:MAG TPA: hypothetical protein VMU78_02165 [Methylocella sp.]|nr:hypothetical protein [Methylocella sp.]
MNENNYQIPFQSIVKLDKPTLTIGQPKLTSENAKRLGEGRRNNRTSE